MEGETATSSGRPEELSLNEEEDDCLQTNRVLLSQNVRLVPELWTYLRQNRLTGFMENKIKLGRTEYEQVGELLDVLAKRTLRDFHDFRDALVATCQRHVVESCLTVSSSSSDADQKSIWKEHQVVLEDMIRPTDALLNATTTRKIINHSQKDDILGTTEAKEKIQKMLMFLAINGVTDLTLHEALKEADQRDVVDFLTGTCALMTTEQKNSLKRKVLAEAISLDNHMIRYLIERRILNKSEKDIIQNQTSEHERVRCLLDIIGYCSRSTYDVFVQALSSTGQREAVSILKPDQVYRTEKAKSAAGRIVELCGIHRALNTEVYQLARKMLIHDDLWSMKSEKIATETELLFSITMAKMVKSSRNPKMNDTTTLQQGVGQHAQVLREIAGLSVVSIENTTITMTFTREELHERGVTDDAIECGLFVSSLQHRFGERNEERFHIPHLATLELLAGLGNTQKDIESLLCLVRRNNGLLDMVIMFTVGIMGNPGLWPVLLKVFPQTMTDIYANKVEQMMKAVLTSSRRHTLGGELFVIHTIAESQQWQLAPDVQRSLTGTSISTSITEDRQPPRKVIEKGGSLLLTIPFLNADDGKALGKLLAHTTTPYSQVLVWGDIGIDGLSRLAASAPCVIMAGTHISAVGLQQSHDQMTGLRGLGLLRAGISRYTLPGIAPALAELHDVDAVDLSNNQLGIGSEGNIQPIAATSTLGVISHQHRYLRLGKCDLSNTDISALLSGSTRRTSLLHLEITDNKLSGVDELAAYMVRTDTVLQGLVMKGCGVRETCEPLIQALQANRELRCLDLSFNEGIPAGVCEMLGALLSSPDTVLDELHVSKCNLDVSALLYPLTLPTASPHVTSLNLTHNDTARHAIAQLCQIMTCTRSTSPLWYLSLAGCRLQDNHLDQLTRALLDVSSKLTTLNVSHNWDLTISSIITVINNTRLDQLWVADCYLSSNDYVQLFTAINRPDCSIKGLATGTVKVTVDLQSGLQQLFRPLEKLLLFCSESQRAAVGECVEEVKERLGAPGMIICCSHKYSGDMYRAESGAYFRHLPPHARAMMTQHPGWHDW